MSEEQPAESVKRGSSMLSSFARWGLVYEPDAALARWDADEILGATCIVFWSWTASRHTVSAAGIARAA